MNDQVIEEHLQHLVEEATSKGMLRHIQMGIEPTLGTYVTHSGWPGPVLSENPDPDATFESDEKCGCRAHEVISGPFNYVSPPSMPWTSEIYPQPWPNGVVVRMTPMETMQAIHSEIRHYNYALGQPMGQVTLTTTEPVVSSRSEAAPLRQYNYELDRLDTISDTSSVTVASTRAEARHEKKRANKRQTGAKR